MLPLSGHMGGILVFIYLSTKYHQNPFPPVNHLVSLHFVAGDTVFQYFLPFTFTRTSDDQLDLTSTSTSNFVALVYDQINGRITVPIETDFCGPQIFDRLAVTMLQLFNTFELSFF